MCTIEVQQLSSLEQQSKTRLHYDAVGAVVCKLV